MAEKIGNQSDSPEATDDLDWLQPEEPPSGGSALWPTLKRLWDLDKRVGSNRVDVSKPGELFDL